MPLNQIELASMWGMSRQSTWWASPEAALYAALILSLSPAEEKYYLYLEEHPGSTSEDLQREFKTTLVSASTMLCRLRRYGLVRSEPRKNESGLYNLWYLVAAPTNQTRTRKTRKRPGI